MTKDQTRPVPALPAGSAEVVPASSRRQVLQMAGIAGAGAVVLAACGSSTTASTSPAVPAAASPDAASPTPTAPAAGGGKTLTLGPATDVPVGSGKVYTAEQVVVTQPTAGTFKAFSAVCPHQGCTVADVTDTINCACHGSRFAIADGSHVSGPAPTGLAAATVKDVGGTLQVPSA